MRSKMKNNQHPEGTSAQVLDHWTPLTPTKPDLPLFGDSARSHMNPTGERNHDSNSTHVHTGNIDAMNVPNDVNDAVGEGQRILFSKLLQSNPVQFVNDSNFSYSPMLNPQIVGFNQLMYMADSRTLNHGLAGMNSFCQHNFQASSSLHSDVQTLRIDHCQVSPLAPATPDLRGMQNMFFIDPANLCIDGQGKRFENDICGQIHSPLEGESAISQDQVYHVNQKNASICQLVNSNMEKSSVIPQQSILTASPTSIQPVTPLKGSNVHEGDGACQTIDLNESPSQNPKRRRHRPKVAGETKAKKTQGPVTPQQPPREKRKYVRKSTPKDLTTTPPECGISPSELTRSGGKKASCRRALNFNSPDCRSDGNIINGGSCFSVVDDGSDPQPKGTLEKGYLQPKPGEGLVIDLNYSPMPTKDFHSENLTPLNMIVRTEPMRENMKHLARRMNTEHHVLRTKTKSLKNLSDDSSNNEIGLKRGFYGTDAMNKNSLNPTNCKKSKPYLFQKGDSRNDPLTDSITESNGYSSPLHHRNIDARIEHNGRISNLTCNGSSLCSNCQRTSVHGPSSSMQFVPSEGSGDFPAHFAHSPKIAHGIISCQATGKILRMDAESQNAIVLYGGNKQIVSYEGPVIKKKPQRAKVELDGETLRIWDMLMWKQGENTNEKQDSKKEEWWAEERSVFKGRVDSFIARMHLIQGDRRFSRWKGSVLDSVVGVFLTQNVSDHLSSSAFMSLAAKFPLHPKRSCNEMHHGELAKRDSPVGSEGQETASERGMSSEHLESSFREIFQVPGDGKRTYLNEEVGLCHEKGLRDEVDWVGSSQFSTSSDKDEPKVQKDFLDARGFVENMTAKNHVCQPVPEDASELLQVEDVLSSQNSAISSRSSTGSYLQLVHEACSNAQYHMKTNVASGSCRKVLDTANTPFSVLLQMQEDEWQQKLSINSEAIADQPNKENYDTTYERWTINSHEHVEESSPGTCDRNSYSSSLKETTKPDWRSSDWTYVPQDETKSHLHPPVSNDAGYNYADYHGLSQESMHPVLKYATSPPFSAACCSSVDNSCIRTSGDAFQSSFEFESWLAAGSQHRLESELHSDTVESMEDSSCVNNMYSVKTRAAQPESSGQLFSGEHVFERQEQPPGPANQEWAGSASGGKAAESATIGPNSAEKLPRSIQNYDRDTTSTRPKPDTNTKKSKNEKKKDVDWDSLRKEALKHQKGPRSPDTMDSLDYEALRCADVREVSDAIKERGMNNRLAQRIQDLLNRLMQDHGSLDLEWLRDVPPDKAKEYLLSINGLGLKSVECVRLLTLLQLAFPVDTNVGRIAVRLGWVPLQPLPESLQLHLLELYPILESVQKYLWPRLCTLAQTTLYELHYQMITFGKVFCTKNKPNCNACPLRAECRHFASAFASARLALPGPEDKSIALSTVRHATSFECHMPTNRLSLPFPASPHLGSEFNGKMSEPIIEEPLSPEPEEVDISQDDMEEAFWENDIEDIPTIRLNVEDFSRSVKNYMLENKAEFNDVDMSKALVALSEEAASIPTQKLKSISRLRTEHQVYELPDNHVLLSGLELRETDDPSPYLLAIWTPGETANSFEPPEMSCGCQESGNLCNKVDCFACNSRREAYTQTVRGTLLIPCRTATRGSFPLNGTYFQVNEIFADHVTSLEPINVPRALIWNLPKRTVYFGTSVPTIFRGQTKDAIQYCFWRGFICVRGFDRNTRAPRPLMARLHLSVGKVPKTNNEKKKPGQRK